jgi:hypothetical protein
MSDDPWMKGPWQATPLRPIYPAFGAPPAEKPPDTIPPYLKPLWNLGAAMAQQVRDPRSGEFARLMSASPYPLVFALAFNRGYMSGCLHGLDVWIGDLQERMRMYFKEVPALTEALGAEVARAMREDNPTGLSKEARMIVDASNLLAPLKVLAYLTAKNDVGDLLSRIGIAVEDIVEACIQMGEEWLDEFFASNGNADRQGFLGGELYGVVTVQIITFVVESLVENAIVPSPF